jgi:hypothetical protein
MNQASRKILFLNILEDEEVRQGQYFSVSGPRSHNCTLYRGLDWWFDIVQEMQDGVLKGCL